MENGLMEYLEKIKVKKRVHNPSWTDKNIAALDAVIKALCPGFTNTPEVEELYLKGLKYFHSDETCGWDLNKGIYLYGVFGVGKTLFFNVFNSYLLIMRGGFRKVTSDEIMSRFATHGFQVIEELCAVKLSMAGSAPINLFIDDVGQGANSVKYYGSSTNVIVEILQRRYRCLTDGGLLTHLSTNLEPTEIKDIYGEYISSRAKEMFNPILFPGKDKRH